MLKYNFIVGNTDFKEEAQPRDFINLKTIKIRHLKSAGHSNMLKSENLDIQRSELLMNRNYKVGIHVGMQA